MPNLRNKIIIFAVIVFVLAGAGFLGYKYFPAKKQNENSAVDSNTAKGTPMPVAVDASTRVNDEYGFLVKVPVLDYTLDVASLEYKRNSRYDELFAIDSGKQASSPAYFIGIKKNISSIDSLKEFMKTLPGAEKGNLSDKNVYDEKVVEMVASSLGNIPVMRWFGRMNNNTGYIISIGESGSEQEYYKVVSGFKFTK